ncbi:Threonyl/alanyl tRNA synthetase [Coniella lustricola]|uniref:Threonyl/alanyl tRNA synthetase n=1 Tax=Coniella lustricola TaxID=2025994 RepID=A0A2T3A0E5_9PEZI|nr:Threonyl/alanyl tRNA synthetase [Coniella lustricola]
MFKLAAFVAKRATSTTAKRIATRASPIQTIRSPRSIVSVRSIYISNRPTATTCSAIMASSSPPPPTAAETATEAPDTHLAFHHDAKLYKLVTKVVAVIPFSQLEEANRGLFVKNAGAPLPSPPPPAAAAAAAAAANADKGGKNDEDMVDDHHVVVTEATIFHPQGGGQPSDVGVMTASTTGGEAEPELVFDVESVRMDAVQEGRVLHYGRFRQPGTILPVHTAVTQAIDIPKRTLYSRLHTAGHVLGAAVRATCASSIAGFDELKASHFPDAAACEFAGLIAGTWKEEIQKQVDKYIEADLQVVVEWWDEDEFRKRGLERLIPQNVNGKRGGEKLRVVNIVGAEVYPCGGTHVDSTRGCGETKVKKISRSKGQSRVSYTVV